MDLTDPDLLLGPSSLLAVEATSALVEPPPLVLRLDAHLDRLGATEVGVLAERLSRLATVVVLVSEQPDRVPAALVEAADIALWEDDTAAAPHEGAPRSWVRGAVAPLVEAIAAQPRAALAGAALLRTSEPLPVWSAAAAEAATYGLLLGSEGFARWLAARGPAAPRPHDGPMVRTDATGEALTITLARPEARNAVNSALRDELVLALAAAEAEADGTHGPIHLRGEGPSFSAGGDLQEFGATGDPATTLAVRLTRHPGLAVAAVADRLTAFVHGPCYGAGVEVPAFAHRVVADAATTFTLPELAMGLVPGAGGTVSIPRRIGRHRAAWLALSGTTISADTALAWGLVDEFS